jgi:hypothetical protein
VSGTSFPKGAGTYSNFGSALYGLPAPQLILRLTRMLLLVGFILAIVGASTSSDPKSAATARSLTRASVVLYMAAFIVLFGLHVMLWGAREQLQTRHRRVSLSQPCDVLA